MNINDIENEIADHYRWWAEQAPGVTPKEEGRLEMLWAAADLHYAQEVNA